MRNSRMAALVLCWAAAMVLSHVASAQAPRSASILFVSNHGMDPAERGLYLMDTDGSNVRRLLPDITAAAWPVWSPDGSQIALGISPPADPATLHVTDTHGGEFRNIAPELPWSGSPTWAPDASKVAFYGDFQGIGNIHVAHLRTGEVVAVTNRVDPAGGWRPSTNPSWSPDGRRIAFCAYKHNNWQAPRYIWTMSPDGSDMRALVTHESQNDYPAYSRDGSKIAFVSDRHGQPDIYTIRADGSRLRRVTHEGLNHRPRWSPDGTRIVFYRQPGQFGNAEVWVVDANGDNPMQLTDFRGRSQHPDWFDPAFSVSPVAKQVLTWGWLKRVGFPR